MPKKKSSEKPLVDDDFTFYKNNIFLVKSIDSIANSQVDDNTENHNSSLLKRIINSHEILLKSRLRSEPLCELVELIEDSRQALESQDDVIPEKSPLYFWHYLPSELGMGFTKDYANERMAIFHTHKDINDVWIVHKNNEKNIDTLTKHFEKYVPIAAGLLLIEWLRQSPDSEKSSALLLCMAALIKLDQMKLYSLFRSEAYEDDASRRKGKRHSDALLKHMILLEEELKSKAIDLWDNKDDQRWHAQMARDLTPEVNAPAIEKIVGELSKKYPRWETDENEKIRYKKEYKKRIKYETLSLGKATEVLYEAAKPFKKNRGPSPNKDGHQLNIEYFDHILSPDFHIPIDGDD